MKTIHVSKAQPIGDQVIEPVTIVIEEQIPAFTAIGSQDHFCNEQARSIELVLIDALPGATYDALLGAMLARKASHFRVTHRQPEPDQKSFLF